MLTTRAWWILLLSAMVLGIGLLGDVPSLSMVGFTLLVWLLGQWLVFNFRTRIAVPLLWVEREVGDDRASLATLWAQRSFHVRVTVRSPSRVPLPFVAVSDFVPFGTRVVEGKAIAQGPLDPGRPLRLAYRLHCTEVGLARFEGVRLRIADFQGLYYRETFLPTVEVYPVLPRLIEHDASPGAGKPQNQLPPPGVHQHRRPGSGSELLDLRDYQPGDPPRTIAWKVSARRDKLITKEFESEVPVRCTLFVDTSGSVRLTAEDGRPMTRLLDIASAVIQASHAQRDLTGLCLFDEQGTEQLRPARTGRHLNEMLRMLAGAGALSPFTHRADPDTFTQLAYPFAREVYPYLMRPGVNSMPFWAQWFAPFPRYTRRRVGLWQGMHRRKWRFLFLATSVGAVVTGLAGLAVVLLYNYRFIDNTLAYILLLTAAALYLMTVTLAWGQATISLLFGHRLRRMEKWRKQLAALLCLKHDLAPGGTAALMEDDDLYVLHLQKFLGEHRVPYTVPLYDRQGRFLFHGPEKVKVLATALLRAVQHGLDNELFVLLADLLELDGELDPLLKAVRVAVSKHHRVLLVCPWPPGLAVPDLRQPPAEVPLPAGVSDDALGEYLDRLARARYDIAYRRVRREFTRLGAQVVCAAADEAVPLVLKRMDEMRRLTRV